MLGALALVAVLALPPTDAHAQLPHLVRVDSNFFEPEILEIEPGDTVVWLPIYSGGHTVTHDHGLFDFYRTRTINRGEPVHFTFTAPGNYPYYCRVHGAPGRRGMAGSVVVTAR